MKKEIWFDCHNRKSYRRPEIYDAMTEAQRALPWPEFYSIASRLKTRFAKARAEAKKAAK